MVDRLLTLRSNVTGNRPPAGHLPGELYVNFADGQIGAVNTSSANQDLIAVRYFSTNATYAVGDFVLQAGNIYRAKVASAAGAFVAANWDMVATASGYLPLTGGTLTGPLTVNGATVVNGNIVGGPWVEANAGVTNRGFMIQTNGSPRWWIYADAAAESGSNAGSNFEILRGSDAGATIDSPLVINRATGQVTLTYNLILNSGVMLLNGPAAANRGIWYQTAGSNRWLVDCTNTAESGANAGSDFAIYNYSDTAVFIGTPLAIKRSTGAATFGSGNVTLTGSTANGAHLYLTTPAVAGRNLWYQTNGVNRWVVYTDGSAESGSNAGSNFEIGNYTDAGVMIGTPFSIIRGTGVVGLNNGVNIAGPTSAPNPGVYDTTQSIATMATVSLRGMTAGTPVIHQSGADAYPDQNWTGRLLMMQTANSIFLPGSGAGSQATMIVTNTSAGAVGIAGANLSALQAGDGAILVGDGAGGFHCVGLFRNAGQTRSTQAEDYTISVADGEVHFTADATVTIPDDLAHAVEVSCDPGVTVTFASDAVVRSVPQNRTGSLSMVGPGEVTLRRKGEEIWLRGDVQ